MQYCPPRISKTQVPHFTAVKLELSVAAHVDYGPRTLFSFFLQSLAEGERSDCKDNDRPLSAWTWVWYNDGKGMHAV